MNEAIEAAAAAGRPATVTVEHPSAGALALVGSPIRLAPPSGDAPMPPPRLGEHTREILAEAGVDAEAMIAAGVAATAL